MSVCRTFRLIGIGVIALIVMGCGTSTPVRYYGLVPVESEARFTVAEGFSVSVGPVRVAEYLSRARIVTRGAGVDVKLAEYDRWSEPLGEAFERTLTDNLAALLGSDRVLDFPAQSEPGRGYQLPAQVTRFDSNSAGLAVLEVQWLIKSANDPRLYPARRSRYTTRVPQPDQYPAIVESLSALVGAFSRDVAAILTELP